MITTSSVNGEAGGRMPTASTTQWIRIDGEFTVNQQQIYEALDLHFW